MGNGRIRIYSDRGAKLIRTLLPPRPGPHRAFSFLSVDQENDVYAVCGTGTVCEYINSEQRELVKYPKSSGPLATNADSDAGMALSTRFSAQVCVFASGARQPFWTITSGTVQPVAMTFASTGSLYLTNGGNINQMLSGSIAIYGRGNAAPSQIITTGITVPSVVALKPDNTMFVYNTCGGYLISSGCSIRTGDVVVYPPGGSTPKQTITDGIVGDPLGNVNGSGNGLALDDGGYLYAANTQLSLGNPGNVVIYAPGSKKPFRTITNGIGNPEAIAVGP